MGAITFMTLILSNDDVSQLLTMRECIDVLEDVYVELANGRGVNRVRSDCLVPSGQGDALYSLNRWMALSRSSASARSVSIPTSSLGLNKATTCVALRCRPRPALVTSAWCCCSRRRPA